MSSRSVTTSIRAALPPTSPTATTRAGASPRSSRGHGRSPGNHDWGNTGGLRQPRRLLRLLRRRRHRRERQELLQLRHPVEQLARRQPRQRVRRRPRRLHRRLTAGALAESRPRSQQHQERHRPLAQADLQLGRIAPDRPAALRRRSLRGRGRPRPGRPRPRLRDDRPARRVRQRPMPRTAFATSRSGRGGDSHQGFGTPIAGSEVREGNTYGILKLTLHPSSYDWTVPAGRGQHLHRLGHRRRSTMPRPEPNNAPVATG